MSPLGDETRFATPNGWPKRPESAEEEHIPRFDGLSGKREFAMSIGPMGGIAGSAAGSPLAQTQGSEPERAQQDASAQQRRVESDRKADSAAGIGEADGEDHETADRDADGRRFWEEPPEPEQTDDSSGRSPEPKGKDTSGQSGTLLDLSG